MKRVISFVLVVFSFIACGISASAQWVQIPGYGINVAAVDSVVYGAQNTIIGRALGVRGTGQNNGLGSYSLQGIFEKGYSQQRMPEALIVEAKVQTASGAATLAVWVSQAGGSASGTSVPLQNNGEFVSYEIPTTGLSSTSFDRIQIIMNSLSQSADFMSVILLYRAIRLRYSDGTITLESFGTATSVTDDASMPEAFSLSQNYPNPFNPTTTIRYNIPEAADVSVRLMDVLGREVAVPEQGFRTAGVHEIHLDAGSLASGTYLYVLRAGGFMAAKSMILLK